MWQLNAVAFVCTQSERWPRSLFKVYVWFQRCNIKERYFFVGHLLYLLYTTYLPLPQSDQVKIDTFADDTVVLSVHSSSVSTSAKLQEYLDILAVSRLANKGQ